MATKKVLIWVLLLFFPVLVQAQKVRYDDIHPLMQQEAYDRALPLLIRLLERSPQHAYAHYQIGKIQFARLKALGAQERKAFEQTYDSAQLMIEKGIYFVKKKDLRKNRKYYEQELRAFKPDLPTVQMHYQELLSELNIYYIQVTRLYEAQDRLQALYRQAEKNFTALTEKYPDMTHLLFRADEGLLNTLETFQETFDSVRIYEKRHQQITEKGAFARFSKRYLFNEFEGFQARLISQEAFKDELVVLYDYGIWSKKLSKKIREEIIPLRTLLPEADKRLNAALKAMESGYYGAAIEDSDLQLIYDLFKYDSNSLAARLLLYKRLKVEYELLKANAQLKFDSLKIAVDESRLLKKLEECRDVLEKIQPASSEMVKYQSFVEETYGGEAALKQFLAGERTYLRKETQEVREGESPTPRKKPAHSIPLAAPQIPHPSIHAFKGELANRDSILAFGGFVTTHMRNIPGGGKLIAGICPSTDQLHQDAFLARLDPDQEIVWFRRFMQRSEKQVFNFHVSELSHNQQFTSLVGLGFMAGSRIQYQVASVSYDGELLFKTDVPNQQVLREAIITDDEGRTLLVSKGAWQQDQFDQMEHCRVALYNQFGKVIRQDSIVFKGILADVLAIQSGFVLVGNFLELQGTGGEFIQSQALSNGGFNVFLGFFDNSGFLNRIVPIQSEVPILATELIAEPSGSILIRGKKGNYMVGGKEGATGGDLWEYRF